MPDSPVQRFLRRPMIDGQLHADLRDLDIAHDPVAAHVQKLRIAFLGLRKSLPGKGFPREAQQRLVVGDGLFFLRDQLIGVQLLHRLVVARFHHAAVFLPGDVADKRVQRDAQGKKSAEQAKGPN